MDKNELVRHYHAQVKRHTELLNKKRMDLGEADSGKESRFPTGRVELETEIIQIENRLENYKNLHSKIVELLTIRKIHVSIDHGVIAKLQWNEDFIEYLFVSGTGDFDKNIISLESPIGKLLHKAKVGTIKRFSNDVLIKVLEIK